MKHLRLTLIGLTAAILLAAVVGTASANRLSLTNRNIRVVWSSLEFVGPVTFRCRFTIEGSFHENTIAKVETSLLGYITAARFAHPCTNASLWAYNGSERNEALGNATLPTSLPWHVQYVGFDGTLPSPGAIRIRVAESRFLFRASFFGIPILCAYRNNATNGFFRGTANLGAGGVISSLRAEARMRSETGGCPELEFTSQAGDGLFTLLGNTNRVSITLI